MDKKFKLTGSSSPRSDIKRVEKIGDCFMSGDKKHFYLVRENDILHVNTEGLINTLFDNHITDQRIKWDIDFIKITRSEFNEALNKVVFELDYFGKEYSV